MTTDEVRALLALAEAAQQDDGRCTFACRNQPSRPCLCGGVERRALLRFAATPAVVAALAGAWIEAVGLYARARDGLMLHDVSDLEGEQEVVERLDALMGYTRARP